MELESTRDDLLFEVFKIKEETSSEEPITESVRNRELYYQVNLINEVFFCTLIV